MRVIVEQTTLLPIEKLVRKQIGDEAYEKMVYHNLMEILEQARTFSVEKFIYDDKCTSRFHFILLSRENFESILELVSGTPYREALRKILLEE